MRPRTGRPYKKNEQAYIESFNRIFRKEYLGWNSLPAWGAVCAGCILGSVSQSSSTAQVGPDAATSDVDLRGQNGLLDTLRKVAWARTQSKMKVRSIFSEAQDQNVTDR